MSVIESSAFSILMPLGDPDAEYLKFALDSVLAQDYQAWELCIAGNASPEIKSIVDSHAARDARIHAAWISRDENGAANTVLSMAGNPYAVLLNPEDALAPAALRMAAEKILEHPDGLLFFSDEDKIGADRNFFDPYFKNGQWDWELLTVQDYFARLGIYRTGRMREIGGFREGFGACRDYDLGLRYVMGASADSLIHIPAALYHRRAHAEGLTEADIKEEAGNAARAVQEYLDKTSPGALACVPYGSQWPRVKYPMPDKRPLVSLILDMGKALSGLKAQLDAIDAKTAYDKREIIILHDDCPRATVASAARLTDRRRNARLVYLPGSLPQAARLRAGAIQARGQILGFLAAGIAPVSEAWLEEMVSCLCRSRVGACGGMAASRDGLLTHGGYLADASGHLKNVFSGVKAGCAEGREWTSLARTVDALDGICFFTSRETLEKFAGFDQSLPDSSIQDYCLRLGEKGLRTVWWPYARFLAPDIRILYSAYKIRFDREFKERWAGLLAPCNENLDADLNRGWTLSHGEAPQNAEFSVYSRYLKDFSNEDYLALYPEVAASGIAPLVHYLHNGVKEGRKPCRTRIDYSRVTPERLAAFQAAPKGKVVVCTSVVGEYDRLLPPAFLNDGWRYICYTNEPLETYGIWELRPIPYDNPDPVRQSRWAKLHLPELFTGADWALWIDSNVVIGGDLSPLLARDQDAPIYSMPHPVSDCLYDEAVRCMLAHKDGADTIHGQVAAYAAAGMPRHFGLYENWSFLINPGHAQCGPLFSQWWKEYEKHSRRDQLSFPFVLYQNNISPGRLYPDDINGRRYDRIYFLTHEETKWNNPPEWLRR